MTMCSVQALNGDRAPSDRGAQVGHPGAVLSLEGLRAWLLAWAHWRHEAHAWADCCPLGRARDATRSGVPGARLPTGVEIPHWVVQVAQVMDLATQAGGQVACNVGAVQAVYLAGHADYADVAKALGCSVATLKIRRQAGEMYLLGWLNRAVA